MLSEEQVNDWEHSIERGYIDSTEGADIIAPLLADRRELVAEVEKLKLMVLGGTFIAQRDAMGDALRELADAVDAMGIDDCSGDEWDNLRYCVAKARELESGDYRHRHDAQNKEFAKALQAIQSWRDCCHEAASVRLRSCPPRSSQTR